MELLGELSEVEIRSPAVQLNVQKGSIKSLILASTAQDPQSAQSVQINLAAQTAVANLIADTPVVAQGQGTIETTLANVDGVVIETPAKNVLLVDGVRATVAGKTITENYQYVESKKKKSHDTALSDLILKGVTGRATIPGFDPDILSYNVVLPYGSDENDLPLVEATARHAKAKVEITQAGGFVPSNNIATILVTAESGRTQTYTVCFSVALDTAKAITDFCLFAGTESGEPEAEPLAVGMIHEGASPKIISVTVPHGTDVSALVPIISHTGESISPASGEKQDFTNPVLYSVTAVDGSTAEYTVTVIALPSADTALAVFTIGTKVVYDVLELDLPGNLTGEDGAILAVSDFGDLKGIAVEPVSADVQSVTVTVNGEVVEDLAEQVIQKNDVIVVKVVAEGGNTAQYKVTVVSILVEGITVTGAAEMTTVEKGQTLQLSAAITPEDATDKTVTWSVVDGTGTGHATIDNNGLLTGETEGTVTVTATANDGSNVKGFLEATVVISVTGVSLNKAVMFLQEGSTAEEALIAIVKPDEATTKDVTWSSSDEIIAIVDAAGLVTAKSTGTVKITATTVDGGKEATCDVTVVGSDPIIDESCVLYLDGRYGTNDPTTQTWYDLSGNGNHGTLNNFAYAEGSGWTGQGLEFDGVNDYVKLSKRPTFSDFTLEITFRPCSTTKNYQGLFTYREATQGVRIGLFLNENKLYWEISSNRRIGNLIGAFSAITVVNNNTYTVFLKRESDGKTYIFFNGDKYYLGLCEGNFTDFDTDILIGKHLTIADQYAKCEFKTVRFYNRALTDAEVMQNYLATKTPMPLEPVDGAVLDLHGIEDTGDPDTLPVWTDASGYDNHATLHNVEITAGEGLKFNGESSFAEIADKPNQRDMTELTLECWYRPYSWEPMYYGLISKWNYPNRQHYLLGYVNDKNLGMFYFSVCNGEVKDKIGVPLPELNQLTHITATFVGGKSLKIYYNGILQGSQSTTVEKIYNITKEPLYVGRYATYSCHGEIYGARIYPKALTDAEVLQNYLADKNKYNP